MELNRRTWALAAGACVLIMASCSSGRSGHASLKPAGSRHDAPDFSLQDPNGRTVKLSDYRGKVVLLNFWATWCGPCKAEIPWFIDFERQHKDQGFAVVGVSMDEDGWQAIKPFMTAEGINYRVLLGNDQVGQLYGGISALPTTFIIDREGRIATVHEGLVSKSTYENDLSQLFEASAGGRAASAPVTVARADRRTTDGH